jgi:hypothetical protein
MDLLGRICCGRPHGAVNAALAEGIEVDETAFLSVPAASRAFGRALTGRELTPAANFGPRFGKPLDC